ncbi:MAG: hypothetical protein ACKVQK_28980 [Burkholderiales bacterium]
MVAALAKIGVVIIVAATLLACGNEEATSANAGAIQKAPAKPQATKPIDDAPRVVDPTKDGY